MLWVRKAVECFKHCPMGHTSRSMEDSGAECDLMNCGGLAQEVTEEILACYISMLPKDHPRNSLVKKVAVSSLV